MSKPSRTAMTPRQAALSLLNQVLEDGRMISELIGHGAFLRLDPADRARAQRLALDTLRGLWRADKQLAHHLKKTPPLAVQNILRLATVELCLGGDAHGIVNEAVTMTGRDKRIQTMKGMVNAVLRKIAATGPQDWAKQRAPRIPYWLREPLVECYGTEDVARLEQAHFAGPALDITAKGDSQAVCDALGGTLLPTGSIRLQDAGQVSALPGFATGDWWVQDAAAALPAKVLNVQPGESVLDMCAAPGGKTMQMAALGADVTALDVSENRMARVRENLERTGLDAGIVTGDALEHEGQYDAILLDAPCSATGTIRRHPDLPYAKDGSEFAELFDLQAQMLDHAVGLLAPGGRLVFATCSLFPDEGECQIEDALERHPDMTVDPDALDLPGVDAAWRTAEGGLRLLPSYWRKLGGMDGFYMACLRKS
ncbi:RsmB/NOP family class I SAM-dependent RNA methyltransferase [Thalassovita sp.]|uniref:RsmB/NOP family class I SAM-dependent RNA methyltransferase n=1 Tax=Thalassovita sp. TaxID=1979401 RepID=UPI0039B6EFCB